MSCNLEFQHKGLEKEIALTEEEKTFFEELEYKLWKQSGYAKLSGSFSTISFTDCEGDVNEGELRFDVFMGVEGESRNEYGYYEYDRKTKEVKAL